MKNLKSIFGFIACGFMMLVFTSPVKALTNYKPDDWKTVMPTSEGVIDGKGYNAGSATADKDSNKVLIQSNSYAGNKESEPNKWSAMYVGPYVEGGNATIADGINEELQIGLDTDKLASQKFFEISFSLKDNEGTYVNEMNVITENVGGEIYIGIQNIHIHGGEWAEPLAKVTTKGTYTYVWELTKKEDGSYITFSVKDSNGEVIGKSEELNIDSTFTGQEVQPISEVGAENVSVRWIWFCNVQTENGVEVYYNTDVVVSPEVKGEDITTSENTTDILKESLETTDDPELKELLENHDVTVELESTKISKDTLEPEEVSKFETVVKGATVTDFFDLSIVVRADGVDEYHLTNLKEAITLSVKLPELPAVESGMKRVYYILRMHDGVVEKIDAQLSADGKSLTFNSDKFSTYAIAYLDEAEKTSSTVIENPKTADNILVYLSLELVSIAFIGLSVKYLKKENN